MSRDYSLDLPHEQPGRPPGGSQEVPRGGRGAGDSRPREPRPDNVRDALAQQLDLPRSAVREAVSFGDRTYHLRQDDVRVLATVGAFRVTDLRDVNGSAGDRWRGDVEHLRQAGLVERTPYVINGTRTAVVTLTPEGRGLLEAARRQDGERAPQQYHAGFVKPREFAHDAQLFHVYTDAAERLHADGHRVERVVLDYELKREYQGFLQERNRAHGRTSGRPDRTPEEVRDWAAAHELPMHDGRVKFPDVRIEYERPDGTHAREDLELATPHYSRAQMAGKAGFTMSGGRGSGSSVSGDRARRGGRPDATNVAAKVLR